jgi:glycerol-3-phosphate cytidylyltransferase
MMLDLYRGKLVGFTCGTFDLMHAGHIMMFEEAAQQCDFLIVGLQTDPTIDRPTKNKPVESVTERFVKVGAVRYVDQVIPYATEEDLVSLLQLYPINVRIIGADYRGKPFTGDAYCEQNNIRIHYNSRSHEFSSSDMRARVHRAVEYTKHPSSL